MVGIAAWASADQSCRDGERNSIDSEGRQEWFRSMWEGKGEDKEQGQEEEHAEEEDEDVFRKPILHSSQLTSSGIDFKGKRIVVLGGGASAVEAVETALSDGAKDAVMVVRDDKVTQLHGNAFFLIC